MKKTLCIILAVLMLMGCVSVATVSAATSAQITLNGKTYSCGSGGTVTYTCNLQSSALVENGQFTLNYPSNVLSIKEVSFPVLGENLIYNYTENLTDKLKFNFSNVNGFDFSTASGLVVVKFDVIANEAGTISLDKEVMSNINDASILSSGQFTETLEIEDVPAPAAPKTTITLKTSSKTLYLKGTYTISATVKNGKGSTTYKSSNTKVATVTSKGKITAKKAGKATITVKNNGVSKKFTVTVKNPTLSVTKKTLAKKGKTFTLKVKGLVGKATFTSSKKKVATVNAKGKVTAKKKGTATIKVKANGITLKCKVTVKK